MRKLPKNDKEKNRHKQYAKQLKTTKVRLKVIFVKSQPFDTKNSQNILTEQEINLKSVRKFSHLIGIFLV